MFSKRSFESFEGSMLANALTLHAIGQSVRENPYYVPSGATEAEVLNNVTHKLLDKAVLAGKKGDYETRIALSELAVEFSPTYAPCYESLAIGHFFLENYEKCIENFNKAWSLEEKYHVFVFPQEFRKKMDIVIEKCEERIKDNLQIKRLITRIKVHNQGMLLAAMLNGIKLGHIKVPEEFHKAVLEASSLMEIKEAGEFDLGMYIPLAIPKKGYNPDALFTVFSNINKDGSSRCGAQFLSNLSVKQIDELVDQLNHGLDKSTLAIDVFPHLRNYVTEFPVLKDLKVMGGRLFHDGKFETTPDKPKAKVRVRKTKQ